MRIEWAAALILLAGAYLFAQDAHALPQEQESARPPVIASTESFMGSATEVFPRVFEKIEVRTLPNGLSVALYPRGNAPVFAGVVAVRVGGSDEHVGETGISHMFEHMAFKGTPEIGTKDYQKERVLLDELEVLAAQAASEGVEVHDLGEESLKLWNEIHEALKRLWITDQFTREFESRGAEGLNATTDSEMTKYFVNLPRTELEFWLKMESERILRPVMRQFYQERDVVMEERRMRYEDDPEGKLYELLRSTAFLAHPYKNPVIGYAFDIRGLTARMLESFHRRFYVPGNIAVAIVGDVRPSEDWPLIEKYFGRIPAKPLPARPHAVEPVQQGERRIVLEADASPSFYVAYRKVQYPHPDDAPISVMLEMLAGSITSPLQRTLVQRLRLAASVSHAEGPGVAYPNLMMFAVRPRAPHTNVEVLEAFDRVLQDFKNSGVTQNRLDIAKRSIATSYLSELASNTSLGKNFATSMLQFGSWKAPFDWYEKAMAVTSADVQRVADQYLIHTARSIAMLERPKAGTQTSINAEQQ